MDQRNVLDNQPTPPLSSQRHRKRPPGKRIPGLSGGVEQHPVATVAALTPNRSRGGSCRSRALSTGRKPIASTSTTRVTCCLLRLVVSALSAGFFNGWNGSNGLLPRGLACGRRAYLDGARQRVPHRIGGRRLVGRTGIYVAEHGARLRDGAGAVWTFLEQRGEADRWRDVGVLR